MSSNEIVDILGSHQCPDITGALSLNECGDFPIGYGGFGDVYQGKLETGEMVAIKCARLFISSTEGRSQTAKTLARELYSWSKCKHPNILELRGLAKFRNQIAIVSPWMDNGTLPYFIERNPGADVRKLCYQISCGVAYLHDIGAIHGDIKGSNVLVSENGDAKLSDFGNTIVGNPSIRFTGHNNQSLSLRWTAPELMRGDVDFSSEADIYALGMTILEVITGRVPFPDKNDQSVIIDVLLHDKRPTRPQEHFSSDVESNNKLWVLLEGCWERQPRLRPNATYLNNQLGKLFSIN